MILSNLKKVTIIADDALETYLIEEVRLAGAKGFTLEEARGDGLHGPKILAEEGRNIKIETVVSNKTAEKILEVLAEKYLSRFSIITYLSDVYVLRGDRFI
ncbi:MAG TPA: transcriptional regulator [Ignavibacteria bacterium]